MRRGMPSMTALLAVLAIAGYQNRDKLAELLGSAGGRGGPPDEAGRRGGQPAGPGGTAGGMGDAGIGGVLAGGLRELVDRFRQSGQGEAAESWVAQGPNRPVSAPDLERAVGADTLDSIARETGLSRQEVLDRLTRNLPGAVDQFTPEGRLPDA